MTILATDYSKCIELSERVSWRVEDVVPRDSRLDFNMPFMPKAMFFGNGLTFLNDSEKLKLNQIFGNCYSYLFYFVEAYIINMAMKHAQSELYGDDNNLRAMLRFAEEEVKHQQLFMRFNDMFSRQFGVTCELVDSPQAVAEVILSKSPMAVLLTTLHIEILTQAHYIDSMRENKEMEPLFASLFKYHWLEESQHAKLDVLELLKLRRDADEAQIETALKDYFDIIGAFSGLLDAQAKLDVTTLERACSRTFSDAERGEIEAAQRRAYYRAFLYDGVTNSLFVEFLAEHFPTGIERATQTGERYA